MTTRCHRAAHVGLWWGTGLLSTLPSFPFPGLFLTISIPAPRGPSFQLNGLPQRFSPTVITAPNQTFGHLVRNPHQNGKKRMKYQLRKTEGLSAIIKCSEHYIFRVPTVPTAWIVAWKSKPKSPRWKTGRNSKPPTHSEALQILPI